jgi:hypothetical protein
LYVKNLENGKTYKMDNIYITNFKSFEFFK